MKLMHSVFQSWKYSVAILSFLVYIVMQIYNDILFNHEHKKRACHSYVHGRIHARKISFWWCHLFGNLTLDNKHMNKRVSRWWLNHLNFLRTLAANSKIYWDYYCFYLMIIHAFCEMLCNLFCNKARGPR